MKKLLQRFSKAKFLSFLSTKLSAFKLGELKKIFGSKRLDKVKKVPVALSIICLSLVVSLAIVNTRPETSAAPKVEKVWPVAVISAESVDMQPKITIYGEVMSSRTALVRSKLRGKIVSLNPSFKDGNFVESGVELLTIERKRYEHQTAEKRADLFHSEAVLEELKKELDFEKKLEIVAKKQLDISARNVERIAALVSQGRESKQLIDDTKSKYASREQDYLLKGQKISKLESRIKQQEALYDKNASSLAIAESELSDTVIQSPLDGFVSGVSLALGQLLEKGETLGRVLSSDELEVRFELPEADYGRFTKSAYQGQTEKASDNTDLIGRILTINWNLGSEQISFNAKLSRIGAEMNPETGGVEMFASLQNDASNLGLRAGAFVEVIFPDFIYRNVYELPERAVTQENEIYVVRDQRLVRLPIEVVGRSNDNFLVRSKINSGELIVSRLFENISPGLRVKVL